MPERDTRHRIVRAAGLDSDIARSSGPDRDSDSVRDSQPFHPEPYFPEPCPLRSSITGRVCRLEFGHAGVHEFDPPAAPVGPGGPVRPAESQVTARAAGRRSLEPLPAPTIPPWVPFLILTAITVLALLYGLFGPLPARPQ